MTAQRTFLFVLLILCVGTVSESRARAEDKKVEPVKVWAGLLDEKKLTELAPAKGYVTSEAALKKVWETWRPGEKLPEVDFTKQVVLVNLCGMYPPKYELKVTAEGDLKVVVIPLVPPRRGYGYGIAVVERSGLKTINGKAIDPD